MELSGGLPSEIHHWLRDCVTACGVNERIRFFLDSK